MFGVGAETYVDRHGPRYALADRGLCIFPVASLVVPRLARARTGCEMWAACCTPPRASGTVTAINERVE